MVRSGEISLSWPQPHTHSHISGAEIATNIPGAFKILQQSATPVIRRRAPKPRQGPLDKSKTHAFIKSPNSSLFVQRCHCLSKRTPIAILVVSDGAKPH